MTIDRQVFIGNLCNVTTETLKTYCESYGPLAELSLNRDKENNIYHCFAFVTFQNSRFACQFLANRPHFLNGEEVFVKRTLPRFNSTIPERLVVTNRLILRDCHKHDKNSILIYFETFGHVKNFDYDQGFIDYEDYDDVDRVLLSRPHYIRDREIHVTKFIPCDQRELSTRENHHRSFYGTERKEKSNSNSESLVDSIRVSHKRKLQQSGYIKRSNSREREQTNINSDEDIHEVQDNDSDHSLLKYHYEELEEQFKEYKRIKELEISNLKAELEKTKKTLIDLTQEKLDIVIQNQQVFHREVMNHLLLDETSSLLKTTEDHLQLTPNKLAKKRKLTISSNANIVNRDFDYYS